MPPSERLTRPGGVAGPTRRQALAVCALTLAASSGCGLRLETDPPAAPTPVPPTADELARERAAALVDDLLVLAASVRRARPDAARQLAVVAADHRAHLVALRPPVAPGASTTASAAVTSISTPTTSTPTASTAPVTTATAVAVLASAERAAATALVADLAAVGPATARLLAAVSGCLQVHVDLLGALPRAAT